LVQAKKSKMASKMAAASNWIDLYHNINMLCKCVRVYVMSVSDLSLKYIENSYFDID
jgi:hypothetical protein